MKKILLVMTLIIGLSASLLAQPMRGPNRNGQGRPEGEKPDKPRMNGKKMSDEDRVKMQKMMEERQKKMIKDVLKLIAEKYELTEEQTKEIEKAFMELIKKQIKLQDKMKKEMEELKKKHEAELKALLGEKYNDFVKEMEKLRKENEPERRRQPQALTVDRIAKMLDLTEEQKKKFDKAFEDVKKQIQELTGKAARREMNNPDMQKKIEKLRAEFEKALKEFLTVKQWEEFNKIRENIFPIPGRGFVNQRNQRNERFRMADPAKLVEGLGLSESQKKDFNELLKKQAQTRAKLLAQLRNKEIDNKPVLEKLKKLTEEFEIELKKILTEEQMKKYQEMKKKASQGFRERNNNRNDNSRRLGPERLIKALELTEEQQKAVKQFLDNFQEQAKKLREERGNPEQMREKMQTLVNELMEKIKSQLTDEQKKKLAEMQEKMKENRENRGKSGRPDKSGRPGMPERPENPNRSDKPESPTLPR